MHTCTTHNQGTAMALQVTVPSGGTTALTKSDAHSSDPVGPADSSHLAPGCELRLCGRTHKGRLSDPTEAGLTLWKRAKEPASPLGGRHSAPSTLPQSTAAGRRAGMASHLPRKMHTHFSSQHSPCCCVCFCQSTHNKCHNPHNQRVSSLLLAVLPLGVLSHTGKKPRPAVICTGDQQAF